jgi:hypothetical protein
MKSKSLLGSVSSKVTKGGLRQISTTRKHLYFYSLLILGTIVIGNFRGVQEESLSVKNEAAQIDELKETIQQLY